MNIHTRNILIGILVFVVVSGGLASLLISLGAELDWEAVNVILGPGAFLGAVTFYGLWNLSGNRKVAAATEAQRAQALAFIPPEGQALLYIVRKGFVAKAAGMDITLDGILRAQLKAPQFTCLVVAPGPHRLEAALGGGAGRQSKGLAEHLTLAPGEVAGVRLAVKMGAVDGTVASTPLSAEEVRQIVGGMKMAAPIDA
jgi:hypothetical protein